MRQYRNSGFLILTFFLGFYLRTIAHSDKEPSKLLIEENKNQWPAQVLYKTDFPGGSLFFERNTLTYLLTKKTDLHHLFRRREETHTLYHHAWKVNFVNAHRETTVQGLNPLNYQRNYYRGNDPAQWAEQVKVSQELLYKGIYAHIDLHFYSSEDHLKYDFILHPGAQVKEIKMSYEGLDRVMLKNGNIILSTSLGEVIEQKPFAYQVIGGLRKEIPCRYELNGNEVTFTFTEVPDPTTAVIIDPTLIASTYTGSTADNWGFTATYDLQGNIYTAGIAAANGYPVTTGAFQTTFGGGGNGGNPYPFDISLSKLNPTGTSPVYSTYYGGIDNEQPHSLIVNTAGELFMVGRTYSSNFPIIPGAYDASHNGGADMILGKFSPTGTLLASTFIGGSGDDGVNGNANETMFTTLKFNYADDGRSEIMLDNAGNVYVAASTMSPDFPVSNGAYDVNFNGGQDGCVIKLNPALNTLLFSTFLGGSNVDAAYGIKVRGTEVYVTGGTASSDFPATTGTLHPTYQGGVTDGYITVLDNAGTALLRSTFIGTSEYDQSYFIEHDNKGNVYILGQTMGAYPVTQGVYSNANSAQFIHKLNNALSASVFSTVIGTGSRDPNISPTAFLIDSCESIYLSGWGRCDQLGAPNANTVSGMPVTANAQQGATDGCDFYFMVLTPNAQSLWYGSFFGELNGAMADHVDGGTSRFDRRGFIYQSVCASCGGGQNFPTTPTAWSTTNKSANCNNAVLKMDMALGPNAQANVIGSPAGCAPLTVQFSNQGSTGLSFTWNFGDGSPASTVANPTHIFNNPGTYVVYLAVKDSIGFCNSTDTAFVVIKVGSPPKLIMQHSNELCSGINNGSASVAISGGFPPYTISWLPGGQTTNSISGLGAGTYVVSVKDSLGCSSKDSVKVLQSIGISVSIKDSVNVSCYGLSDGSATALVAGGTPPIRYSWSTNPVQTGPQASSLAAGTYTVTVKDTLGCTVKRSVTITQPPQIKIMSIMSPADCGVNNGSITVKITGGKPPYTFAWSTVPPQFTATAMVLPPGKYTVVVKDSKGCQETFTDSVYSNSPPKADFNYTPQPVSDEDPTVNFIDLSIGNINKWTWNFGDPLSGSLNFSTTQYPTHTYPDTGKYCIQLKIIEKGGICKDSITKCLDIIPYFTFYVPNAFTPNKDGKNDFFTGYGVYVKDFNMMIFDRWGTLIFETNDIHSGWDGKVQNGPSGQVAQQDVYIYKIKVSSIFNKQYKYTGKVTLVR